MSRTFAWLLLFGMVGLATMAFTGAQGTDPPPPEYPPGTKGMHHHHAATKAHSASGDVTAVDATAKTLTIKGKSYDWTFAWDDKTTVSPKGKTSADVAVGSHVTVSYKVSGDTKTATKISIHAPKAAAAAKTPS